MKKDNDLKNINVNEIAGIKKIYDGCKFCMETRGRICDKAEELFGNKTVLSQYSPFFNNIQKSMGLCFLFSPTNFLPSFFIQMHTL